MWLSLSICGSVWAHIIALVLSALTTTAVVLILIRTELVWGLSTPVECITSYWALPIVCLRTSLGFRVSWLTSTWWLLVFTPINWLGHRSPCWLLSLHLLMFWLRTGIGWFEMFQISVLSWAWWVVISSLIWVIVRIVKDNIGWEPFDNPLMLKSFIRCQSLFRIPFKTSADEIDKWIIGCFS